jgi:hypothetical protein
VTRNAAAAPAAITRCELSAMCDKEGMSFLALNLAHEILAGKKNADEARASRAEAVRACLKGEKHPYTRS